MASAQCTDEELFSELKRFGFTPGPVTENTRPVYLKKLKKLREEQEQRGCRSAKRRSGGPKGNCTGSRPDRCDVTSPGCSGAPGRKSSVLSFSSDESDAENTLKAKAHGHNHRMERSPRPPTQPKGRSGPKAAAAGRGAFSDGSPGGGGQTAASSRSHARPGLESGAHGWDAPENDCGPRSLNGCGSGPGSGSGPGPGPASRVPGDYSDSDEEGFEGPAAGAQRRPTSYIRPADRQAPFLARAAEPGSWPAAARGASATPEEGGGDGKRTNPGLSGNARGPRLPTKSMADMCDDAEQNNHMEGNHGAPRGGGGGGRVGVGLRARFPAYSSPSHSCRGNHSNHSGPNHSYSQALPPSPGTAAVPEDALLRQFKGDEVASPARFSAHYLSMSLLTAACLFFLLLGLMYLRMRGSGSAGADAAGT